MDKKFLNFIQLFLMIFSFFTIIFLLYINFFVRQPSPVEEEDLASRIVDIESGTIDRYYNYKIIADRETDVEYLIIQKPGDGVGVTVMRDSGGTVLKREQEVQMISAVEAKKMTENSFEKIFNYLNEVITYAANDNRYYCLISINELEDHNINEKSIGRLINKIKSLGYNIEYIEGGDIKISWDTIVEDSPHWVKRRRYDGEPFYECSGCGRVAAEKKFCHCPNCKCEMSNGEEENLS